MSFCLYQIGVRRNSDRIKKIYVRVPDGTRIWDAIQEQEPQIQMSQIVSIRLCPVCLGCIENQPNQLAHMGPDGCLELSDDDI